MEIKSSLLNASDMTEVKKSLIAKSSVDGKQNFRVKMLEYINDSSQSDDDEFFFDMLEFVRFLDPSDEAIAYTDEHCLIWLNAPGQVGETLRPWDFIYDHECLHQLWETFGVRDRIIKNGEVYDHDILNIASDCVINDYLASIRKKQGPTTIGIITPEFLQSEFGVTYDRKVDTQYTLYLRLLEKKAELMKNKTVQDVIKQGKIKPKSIQKQNGPTPPPPPPSGPHSDDFKKGWSDAIDDVVDGKVDPTDPKYKPKATGNQDYDTGYNSAMDQIRQGLEQGITISDNNDNQQQGGSDLRSIPWDIPQQQQQGGGSGGQGKSDDKSQSGDKSDDNKSGESGESGESSESGDGSNGSSSGGDMNSADSAQKAADHAQKAADAASKAADAAESAANGSSGSSDAQKAAGKSRKAADKAQRAADKAQRAADKAKRAAGKGDKSGEEKAAKEAVDAANDAASAAKEAAAEAAKTGDKNAKDAAKEANAAGEPFSKGNVQSNAGSNGAGHNDSADDNSPEFDADLDAIRKKAQDVIEKYQNKLTGALADFLKKCNSSIKCEKDGLMVNVERGATSWNQTLNSNVRAFIKKVVAKKRRLRENTYKRPNRRQGIIRTGDYIMPGKRTKKNGIPLKVAFYIDKSSSMGNSVYNAFDACYAICESVKKQFGKEKLIDEIAFDIYTFNTQFQHIDFGKKVGSNGCTCSVQELLEFITTHSKDFLINVIITDAEFYGIEQAHGQIKKLLDEIAGALNFVINNTSTSAKTMQKFAKQYPMKLFYIQADSDFTIK